MQHPLLESSQCACGHAGGDGLPSIADWAGSWALDRRENWGPYLDFLGVPAANHEAATKAPDFHRYRVEEDSFVMDHRIPAQGMHLLFRAAIDGAFHECPYPRPTVSHWAEADKGGAKPPANAGMWTHTWVKRGVHLRTEIPDFAGKGKKVVLERELITKAEIKCTVNVFGSDAAVAAVGPCYTYMRKTSDEVPETPISIATWVGTWELDRRENWGPYLDFLGVPAAAHEAATRAPDFHRYRFSDGAFTMDHRIPAQGMHLLFHADIDGEFHPCPYPRPTVSHWAEGDAAAKPPENAGQWRHTWVKDRVHLRSEIPDFAGKGKTVVLERELASHSEIKCTVTVLDGGAVVVGPCWTYMRRSSDEGPMPLDYLRSKGKPLDTAEERVAALEQAFRMFAENIDALTAAHTADRVSPGRFDGSARMLMGAAKYYQAIVPGWMEPEKLEDTTLEMLKAGVEADFYVHNEPKGTCIVIAPWNAPALLAAIPMLGMLAAGNRVVIKPSEATPNVSALLRRLSQKYLHGFVWVEEGAKDAVERLIDEGADHLCFTGGSEIAKVVVARAARYLTPVTLELGGKSPVFVDVGLSEHMMDMVVREMVQIKQVFCGQFCCAHDYVLVHEGARDAFVGKLRAALEELGERRNVPLANRRHYERVQAMLLESDGEKVPPVAGACVPSDSAMTLPVTAILRPSPGSSVMQDEIFGPLLPVLVVGSVEEAIAQVNSSATGKALIAYCYSEDKGSVEKFLAGTSSGSLCVNAGPQRMMANFHVGFGGVGASGSGVSMWGKEALREFSNRKHVCHARDGFAASYFAGPPDKGKGKAKGEEPKAPAAGASGAAVGEVQKAFAGKGKGKGDDRPPLEDAMAKLVQADAFSKHFGDVVEGATASEQKLMAVRAMLPFARKQVRMQNGATTHKRAAILNGYRDFAEKKGVAWRVDAKALEDRGMEVWEKELGEVTNKALRVPDYYQAHGWGTMHSYDKGNCNWEAAFDAPSAYLLVHLHHYPNLTPLESFDRLHEDLDSLALGALAAGRSAGGAPLRCVDVGCGVGTSTFSLVKSLQAAGAPAHVTGIDLSPHFVAVARHLQREAGATEGLEFKHADGLDLQAAGFEEASVDLLCVSEVTHELPIQASRKLWSEAAKVLRPGGVVGYMDLNPAQILRDNAVGALVTRVAMDNEPYFDEYLELDMAAAMREAGLEVVEESWPAKETWKTAEDASLRLMVARKPPA